MFLQKFFIEKTFEGNSKISDETIKVYGEVSKAPFTEKSKPNPLDFYSKSKLKAENELLKLSDKNFAVSIIRSPLIYGQSFKIN